VGIVLSLEPSVFGTGYSVSVDWFKYCVAIVIYIVCQKHLTVFEI